MKLLFQFFNFIFKFLVFFFKMLMTASLETHHGFLYMNLCLLEFKLSYQFLYQQIGENFIKKKLK